MDKQNVILFLVFRFDSEKEVNKRYSMVGFYAFFYKIRLEYSFYPSAAG
jgi:hypothetical protein